MRLGGPPKAEPGALTPGQRRRLRRRLDPVQLNSAAEGSPWWFALPLLIDPGAQNLRSKSAGTGLPSRSTTQSEFIYFPTGLSAIGLIARLFILD